MPDFPKLRRQHDQRSGFTLVEIVVSIGIMGIAVLASAAGVSVLLMRQEVSYQSTVATSAASLLFSPASSSETPKVADLSQQIIEPISLSTAQCTFRGGPNLNDSYNQRVGSPSLWTFYRFKTGPAYGNLDLRAYQSLIIAIHAPVGSVDPDQTSPDQQVWVHWFTSNNGVNFFDPNELTRIMPHHEWGAGGAGVPATPPLYFGQAVFWYAVREQAENAANNGTPLLLDFAGSYRFLHPAMNTWTQAP